MADASLASTAAPPRSAAIAFGTRDGLFGLLLRNLALGVVTLMIYRFWARTNLRRFFWSRVRVDGDPLEYTGRGSELFVGFLIAMLVLVPLLGGFAVLEQFLDPESTAFVLEKLVYGIVIVTLVALAQFRARRYRLSRTLWRGIRFAQTGSQWTYVGLTLGWGALTLATLGLALPWMRWAQVRYLMRHTRLGDRVFAFEGSARPLIWPWMVVIVPVAGLVVVAVGTIAAIVQAGTPPASVSLLVFVLLGVVGLAFVRYRARELRAMAAATRLGDVRFRSAAQARRIIGQLLLYAVAVAGLLAAGAAVVVLLGVVFRGGSFAIGAELSTTGAVAMVLVAVATYAVLTTLWTWIVGYGVARHVCSTLTIDNIDGLAAIGQSTISGPRSGEGLADSFDVGV